jgi:ABC-2 type transport system permease protein
MRKILALLRAGWLTRASYRLGLLLSLGTLLFTIVPMYFIGNALQPVMAGSIRTEGTQYFGFLMLGTFAYFFVTTACFAIPEALQSGVSTGTLEVLLSTPTRVPTLLAGLTGYNFSWAGIQALFVLLVGWLLGAPVAWGQGVLSLAIVVLIVLAHLPIGLIAGAMVLAFRTQGPLPQLALLASGLLGGVYYPTSVVPAIVRDVSVILPLTYGLRALRRVFLDGLPIGAVATDLAILAGMTAVSLAIGTLLFAAALRYARRAGSLAQY